MLNITHYIKKFIAHERGIISIEFCFVLLQILLLLTAMIEFSIIYSITSSFDRLSRDLASDGSSVMGSGYNQYRINGGSDSRDTYFTRIIHKRITQLINRPELVELCSSAYESLENLNALINNGCVTFNKNPTTLPKGISWGEPGNIVEIKFYIRMNIFTPYGKLLNKFNKNSTQEGLTLSTKTYFYKE